jgi:glycosyltransferase involved in cell wall biosynthesis
MNPGVNHDLFNRSVKQAKASGEGLTVVFLSRMSVHKGSTTLAEAIPLVRSEAPIRYVFAGPDHGAEQATRDIVRRHGVERQVEFRGPVPKGDLPAFYGEADVFVFPTTSAMEGFGMVATEAMACGTPVVASRIGPVPEVVLDGRTGLLFTPGDAEDLAAKLSDLLNDDGLRARLGANAAAHAATFQWSTIGERLAAEPARRHTGRR